MTTYNRPDELVMAESALAGEVQDFPDILRGWGVSFDQTGGIPPMEWFNYVARRTDQATRYFMQRGLAEWSETEDYPEGAYVQVGGNTYVSLRASLDKPPATSSNDWMRWGFTAEDLDDRIKNQGFQFSSTSQYSVGPLTLSASQAGTFVDLAAAYSGDITLPPLSDVDDGSTFYIWSGAAATVNVKRDGSDVIFVNGSAVTSIDMGAGDTLVVGKSGPANAWVAMWGSAQFMSSAVGKALAPKPVNASSVGKFGSLGTAPGVALTLPAGGTWAYFAVAYNSSGQASASLAPVSAVAAGGTVVGPATAGTFWFGFGWRIQ
jgi:hypothetical protein